MSKCLTDEQLESLANRRLPEAETLRLNEHVESCPACRELLSECRENLSFAHSIRGAIAEAGEGPSLIQEYLDDSDSRAPADSIPGYELLHELHRGTQGVVYQALQLASGKQVAIKFLREGVHASRNTRKRFEREIELAASLHHPNIIRVFESGVSATGHHYYAMDYVHGLPLHRYVQHKKLSIEQTLRLFALVCDAVNYAHQHGVIHRDLKPSNVLVDSDGVPHVLDFGLAKPLMRSGKEWASMTGEVVGTLPYMSPEQAHGGRSEVDIRTDVYALGIMLYHVLTGEYPYPVVGPVADVLKHIAETDPVPPRRQWSHESGGITYSERGGRFSACPIDEEVETIILRALAKDPMRRYPNVESLRQDVIRHLQGQPIEAKRDAGLHVLRKSLVRYKAAVVATAASVIVTSAFSLAMWQMYLTQSRERERADAERFRVLEVQSELAGVLMELGDRALDRGDVVEARAKYDAALVWNEHMAAGMIGNLPFQARLADNYRRLGHVAMQAGDLEQAVAYYDRSHRIMDNLSTAVPNHVGYRQGLALGQEALADALGRQGQTEKARGYALAALETRRGLTEGQDVAADALEAYARLLLTCSVEAVRDVRLGLQVAERAVELTRGSAPGPMGVLALAHACNGNWDKARALRAEALELAPEGDSSIRRGLDRLLEGIQPPAAQTRPAQAVERGPDREVPS